jgi:hypothetical protein
VSDRSEFYRSQIKECRAIAARPSLKLACVFRVICCQHVEPILLFHSKRASPNKMLPTPTRPMRNSRMRPARQSFQGVRLSLRVKRRVHPVCQGPSARPIATSPVKSCPVFPNGLSLMAANILSQQTSSKRMAISIWVSTAAIARSSHLTLRPQPIRGLRVMA